jgi:hypothetical protein
VALSQQIPRLKGQSVERGKERAMRLFRYPGDTPEEVGAPADANDPPGGFRVLRDQRELEDALSRAAAQDRDLLDRLSRRAARYEAGGR